MVKSESMIAKIESRGKSKAGLRMGGWGAHACAHVVSEGVGGGEEASGWVVRVRVTLPSSPGS